MLGRYTISICTDIIYYIYMCVCLYRYMVGSDEEAFRYHQTNTLRLRYNPCKSLLVTKSINAAASSPSSHNHLVTLCFFVFSSLSRLTLVFFIHSLCLCPCPFLHFYLIYSNMLKQERHTAMLSPMDRMFNRTVPVYS